MENDGSEERIVIVGAGIAGLATAVGLHRLGIRTAVLESSSSLRTTGFAILAWQNAWRALDALNVGESLRGQHNQLLGVRTFSADSGQETGERTFNTQAAQNDEVRLVMRKTLMETLERELPTGTVRYSSKVVSIEEAGSMKLVHLADGLTLSAKALIGCDGVNSNVAKWLGFKKPSLSGRTAVRGLVRYRTGHGFEPKSMMFFGGGIRRGVVPCDNETLYWFLTWPSSPQDEDMEENPAKIKRFVLDRIKKLPDRVRVVFEDTELNNITMSPLRYRPPWELLWGNISKGNVCVAGDAFHPMTPEIGQGGCSALEDGVVLARCLGRALRNSEKIEVGLERYARERRWRGIELVSVAYLVGCIQQSNSVVLGFLRDKFLTSFLNGQLRKRINSFNCGDL